MQPHLKKCFGAIESLEFTEELYITAMMSAEGERVPLKGIVDTVKARGAVEKWLLQVSTCRCTCGVCRHVYVRVCGNVCMRVCVSVPIGLPRNACMCVLI